MKNKGFTYGLLVIVGIIWYQVFVRVKSNFNSTNETELEFIPSESKKTIGKPNAFDLKANYQDPFRSGSIEETTETNQNIPPPLMEAIPYSPPIIIKPKINWPDVNYYGIVRNTDSKKPKSIVGINGQIFKLSKGDVIRDDIQIIDVHRDYLTILYKKETRIYNRM